MSSRQADLAKLADAFFRNLKYHPDCEYGSIGLDCKRPFGRSDVESDVLEIIGASPEQEENGEFVWSSAQREYAALLYREQLAPYLCEQWRKRG